MLLSVMLGQFRQPNQMLDAFVGYDI